MKAEAGIVQRTGQVVFHAAPILTRCSAWPRHRVVHICSSITVVWQSEYAHETLTRVVIILFLLVVCILLRVAIPVVYARWSVK